MHPARLLLLLLGVAVAVPLTPAVGRAGLITYGGDLAAALGGSTATPALITAGATLTVPFSATVPLVGSVTGNVRLSNFAAASGNLSVTDLVFESDRPAGGGTVRFSIAIDQNFQSNGAPIVSGGGASLFGRYTFTAFPQTAAVQGSAFVQGFGEGIGLRSGAASPSGPFPQTQDAGFFLDFISAPGGPTVNLRLGLDLTLSDNAVGIGPRISSQVPGGAFGSVFYQTSAVPAPPTAALLGSGLCSWFAVVRWRRWGRKAPCEAAPARDAGGLR